VRIVYTSDSLALAVLETVVNAGRDSLPDDLIRIEIEIPDSLAIEDVRPAELTRRWRAYPAPPELGRFGETWVREMRTPVLRVPSAVVPEEFNFLLNSAHPKASGIAVVTAKAFSFDPRLA
jgi:RES domain-containing protein